MQCFTGNTATRDLLLASLGSESEKVSRKVEFEIADAVRSMRQHVTEQVSKAFRDLASRMSQESAPSSVQPGNLYSHIWSLKFYNEDIEAASTGPAHIISLQCLL